MARTSRMQLLLTPEERAQRANVLLEKGRRKAPS